MADKQSRILSLTLLLLALVCTYIPWGWHQNASLTPGARDLAEWTALYPPYHAENPALLPSLLIRASLGLVAVAAAQYAGIIGLLDRKKALASIGIAVLIVLTLLPPAEYLRDRANPNYSQMAGTAIGSTMLGVIVLVYAARRPSHTQRFAFSGLCIGSAILCILGVQRALGLFDILGTPLRVGAGAILFPMILGLLALIEFRLPIATSTQPQKS